MFEFDALVRWITALPSSRRTAVDDQGGERWVDVVARADDDHTRFSVSASRVSLPV